MIIRRSFSAEQASVSYWLLTWASMWPSPVQDVGKSSPVCSLCFEQQIMKYMCPPLPPLP